MEYFISNFWNLYGNSIIMLVIQGVIIAILLEFAVKKAFDTMIARTTDEGKKAKIVEIKTIFCAVAAVILSVLATVCVVISMPLPGNVFLFPTWLMVVYFVQYFFSLVGIKAIKKKLEAEPKPKKKKTKKFQQLEDGTFVEV